MEAGDHCTTPIISSFQVHLPSIWKVCINNTIETGMVLSSRVVSLLGDVLDVLYWQGV